MDFKEHATLVGKVVANLQALEYVLRAFLYVKSDAPHSSMPRGRTLNSSAVGEDAPVNALTDYDSLGRLVDRYNKIVGVSQPHLVLGPSVVELRDALAHGRVSKDNPAADPVLVKFEKPSGGRTKVAYSQKLTRQWLEDQVKLVLLEVKKVAQAPGSPVVGPFP